MNKKKSVIITSLILVVMINIFTASALCTGRCDPLGNGFNMRIKGLKFLDVNNTGASAKADITSISAKNGLDNVIISIKANNLKHLHDSKKPKCTKCKEAYEVWLVDKETDYHLNLGAFTPPKSGKYLFIFKQSQINFLVYDFITITKKHLNDHHPNSKDVVLIADITGSIS